MKLPVLNDPLSIADHEYIVTMAEIHIAEKSARRERKRRDRKFHAENMPEKRKTREWQRTYDVVYRKCTYHGSPIRQAREIIAEKYIRRDFYAGNYTTFAESMAEKIRREEDVCWNLHSAIAEFENVFQGSIPENAWLECSNEYGNLLSARAEYYAEERW